MSKEHIKGCRSVQFWLGRLQTEKSRNVHFGILYRWVKWLGENGGKFAEFSPDELVDYQKKDKGYEILDLLQPWAQSIMGRAQYKDRLYTAVRSFFMHNRAELPRDRGFRVFGDKPQVSGDLTHDEFRRIVEVSNPCMRAVLLAMGQGWMGWEEIRHWSETGLDKVRGQLRANEHPLKIDLPGRKIERNRNPFYTFIGRDAVDALEAWLAVRPDVSFPNIFVTTFRTPLTYETAREYWTRNLKRLGIVKPKVSDYPDPRGIRYGKNLHEIRDVFRTRARYAVPDGFDVDFAEFFMGHASRVDPLKYDKIMRDVDWAKEMYRRVEPWLNIVSEEPGKVDAGEVRTLQRELAETKSKLEDRLSQVEEFMMRQKDLKTKRRSRL